MDYTKLRQCKLGELRGVAAASRPDIRARLAQIASGGDAYRVAKEWQRATALDYASSSRPWGTIGGGGAVTDDLCDREKAHSGSMSLDGWSDAADGDQPRAASADWVMWLA